MTEQDAQPSGVRGLMEQVFLALSLYGCPAARLGANGKAAIHDRREA